MEGSKPESDDALQLDLVLDSIILGTRPIKTLCPLPPHMNLFSFPREIRDMIYELLVYTEQTLAIVPNKNKYVPWDGSTEHHAAPTEAFRTLTRVSKTVNDEVWDSLCRKKTLAFLLPAFTGTLTEIPQFLQGHTGRIVLATVRSLELIFDFEHDLDDKAYDYQSEHYKAIQALANARMPQLKTLRLNILACRNDGVVDEKRTLDLIALAKWKVVQKLVVRVSSYSDNESAPPIFLAAIIMAFKRLTDQILHVMLAQTSDRDSTDKEEPKVELPKNGKVARDMKLWDEVGKVRALLEIVHIRFRRASPGPGS